MSSRRFRAARISSRLERSPSLFSIAISVFDRRPEDHPDDDSIVRIQAGRVRKRLNEYYQHEGAQDPVHISIAKGAYIPVFQANHVTDVDENAATGDESPARRARLPRVGVLPLKNLADSPEDDYFAEGLGEELSAGLASFQDLAVIAYWTTSQFRGDDLDVLSEGRELAADFLICGSFSRTVDRVCVSIQCVHVDSGDQIWAKRFDRRLATDAVFDIQDEIVDQVVARIGGYFGSISRTLFEASATNTLPN